MTEKLIYPEWLTEPDSAEWTDEPSGLLCRIQRHGSKGLGHLCGYVRVLPGHPWFGSSYDDANVEAHGGLTWAAGECAGVESQPGAEWWFGFDCAHSGDLVPDMLRYGRPYKGDVYRNFAYVREQCANVARQLAAVRDVEATGHA